MYLSMKYVQNWGVQVRIRNTMRVLHRSDNDGCVFFCTTSVSITCILNLFQELPRHRHRTSNRTEYLFFEERTSARWKTETRDTAWAHSIANTFTEKDRERRGIKIADELTITITHAGSNNQLLYRCKNVDQRIQTYGENFHSCSANGVDIFR